MATIGIVYYKTLIILKNTNYVNYFNNSFRKKLLKIPTNIQGRKLIKEEWLKVLMQLSILNQKWHYCKNWSRFYLLRVPEVSFLFPTVKILKYLHGFWKLPAYVFVNIIMVSICVYYKLWQIIDD